MSKEQFINIPYGVMRRDDLTQTEKLLIGFINGFKRGECFASNEYIGKLLGIHEKSVSRVIKSLIKKEIITRQLLGHHKILRIKFKQEVTPELPQSNIQVTPEVTQRLPYNIDYNINNTIDDASNFNNNLDIEPEF